MNIDTTILVATIGLLLTIAGGAWGLMKAFAFLMNKALDERFAAIEKARAEGRKLWEERLTKLDAKQERIDGELRELLISMPDKYVRREDYVRRETVIEAKIDRLGLQIQNWILEKKNGD